MLDAKARHHLTYDDQQGEYLLPGVAHARCLARYGLARELHELASRAQHKEGAAVVLRVPSHADGLAPSIDNQLPCPPKRGAATPDAAVVAGEQEPDRGDMMVVWTEGAKPM